jgi:hypothetical protein
MADAQAVLFDSFAEQLKVMLVRHPGLLDAVEGREARELGRRGAEAALAPLIWGEAVGERWSTTYVAEFLGVSRQALHERVKRGTLLGVLGRGTTWFPTWQFDIANRNSRPVVPTVLHAFRHTDPPLAPVEVAAWALSPQVELEDLTPADWLAAGRPESAVVDAARQTAARLAA